MEPYLIEFGLIGTRLGTRFAGLSVREKVEAIFKTTDKIVFNFIGVDEISESFADECFAKLLDKFEMEDIKNKTVIEGADPFIKAAITKSYVEWFRKKSNE